MNFNIFIISFFFLIHISTSLESGSVEDHLEKVEENIIVKLLKLSQKSDESHSEANEIYKSKYGNLTVAINDGSRKISEIEVINNRVTVGSDVLNEFLMGFGQSIERLSIDFIYISAAKHKEIAKWINTHCSEALVEIQVKYCTEGTFDEATKPFTKVENVDFNGIWMKLHENALPFNALFPEMRVLNLSGYSGYPAYSAHIFENNYKNLVEVNIDAEPTVDFSKFFENNSQIKRLKLVGCSMEQLKTVSNNLPNVERLEFYVPRNLEFYQGANITFDNVKELTIGDFNFKMRAQKIFFKQLRRLEIATKEKINSIWMNLIADNTGLETLIITHGDLTNATLTELSARVNGLIEADIRCDSSVDVETVNEFVQSNPQMKKTILNFDNGSILFTNNLNKLMKNEWKVEAMDLNYSRIRITKQDSPPIDIANDETGNNQNLTLISVGNEMIHENPTPGIASSNTLSNFILTVSVATIVVRKFDF